MPTASASRQSLLAVAAQKLGARGIYRDYANESSWFFAVGEVDYSVDAAALSAWFG